MITCSKCGSEFVKYQDEVPRIIREKYGEKHWIKIPRYRCKNCGCVFRVLPENLLPFKHYDKEIIQGVVEGVISEETIGYEDFPCEVTMARWRRTYA